MDDKSSDANPALHAGPITRLRGPGALFLFQGAELTEANTAARELLGFDARAALDAIGRALDPRDELAAALRDIEPQGTRTLHVESLSCSGEPLSLALRIETGQGQSGELVVLAHDCTHWRAMESLLQRRLVFERLISEASAKLIRSTGEELDGVIESVLGSVGAFFDVDRAYVFLFDMLAETQSNTHEWVAAGISREAHNLQRIPLDTYPWLLGRLRNDQVFKVERIVEMPAEAVNERAEFEREGIRSILIVPLWRSGDLLGFAGFDSVRREIGWGDHYEIGLRLMAQMMTGALATRDLTARLHKQALHDALTGLPNRKLLEERFELIPRQAMATGGCITLAVVDVDDFKRVNDGLGHAAGDAVLCEVARRLRHVVATEGTVARLGGDEFVLLLYSEDLKATADLGQRVQSSFSQPFGVDNDNLSIGVSVGLVVESSPEVSFNQLLRRADAAMYRAKAEGKQRWVQAPGELCKPKQTA